jgi:hypothetical protein
VTERANRPLKQCVRCGRTIFNGNTTHYEMVYTDGSRETYCEPCGIEQINSYEFLVITQTHTNGEKR